MLSATLEPLTDVAPPFASVALDASRLSRATGDDPALHWEQQARHLRELGAPEDAIEALAEAVTAQTGLGGEHARVVVASGSRVVLDLVLPERPVREECLYGPVPHLMPVARALADAFPYAVVRLDRAGADLELVGMSGETDRSEVVEGDHDVLHKVAGGGWSHRRYQERVEDSAARNVGHVAERLAQVIRRERPVLVLVMGEDEAVAELRGHAAADLADRLVVLDTGGRAAGTDPEAEQKAIEAALQDYRAQKRHELLDTFAEQLSRQQRAVEGLGPVVDALRRGQVDRLLLHDDPTSTVRLWVGEQPLQLGMTKQDSVDAGAAAPVEVRADAALTWALVGSDAEITLVAEDEVSLEGGIGALLRWSDEATEHLDVPSMPGHGEPPGVTGNVE
jgi:hypothetical protein